MNYIDWADYKPYGVMTRDEAEDLTNIWVRNAVDFIRYSTRVRVSTEDIDEELSDNAWIFEAGEDDDGNELYNMDILRQLLDSITDNTIKEIRKEQKGF